MATLYYELGKPRQNGIRKVSIILSHKGERKRLPTNIYIESKYLSKNGKITSKKLKKEISDVLKVYSDRLYAIDDNVLETYPNIEYIYNKIIEDKKNIDFFQFTYLWIEKSRTKSKKNYLCMVNALKRFIEADILSFTSITYNFLMEFKEFLNEHPRAQSLYLTEIRHMFTEAGIMYNNENKKIIPESPFRHIKIQKYVADTKNRVISEESLVKIFNFNGTKRIGMARDCYVLSFCLIGMNSVDLFECTELHNNILSYNRAKTRDRRLDNAHIEIVIPDIIKPLLIKYKGENRVFNFYTKYANSSNFNKHINKGLDIISKKLDIPKFDFYSARHTWASIARNKLGIDKYTIHEALNHTSDLNITDVYIQRDYSIINKANKMVVNYVLHLLKNNTK